MRSSWRIGLLLLAVGLVGGIGAGEEDERPLELSAEDVPPFHSDKNEVQRAALDAFGAFLREDAAAVRRELDKIDELCRPLVTEERVRFGDDVVAHERPFRMPLNRAREHAGRGDLVNGHHEFVWVQRSCIACHKAARAQGLIATPPSAAD